MGNVFTEGVGKVLDIYKSPSAKAKGLEIVRLPGLVSESVLLWDKIGLKMKRVRSGHIGIYLTP